VSDSGSDITAAALGRAIQLHNQQRALTQKVVSSLGAGQWLNLAKRWFVELTEKSIRRVVFRNVPELIEAI